MQVSKYIHACLLVEVVTRNCAGIDLILMDLRKPVLTGVDAARRIHPPRETCHIPVVAISAHCEGEWMEEAMVLAAVVARLAGRTVLS